MAEKSAVCQQVTDINVVIDINDLKETIFATLHLLSLKNSPNTQKQNIQGAKKTWENHFPSKEFLLHSYCYWPDSVVHIQKPLIYSATDFKLSFSSCSPVQKKLFNKKGIVREQ